MDTKGEELPCVGPFRTAGVYQMGRKQKGKFRGERHQMNRRNWNSHNVQDPVMKTGCMTLFTAGQLPMRNNSTSEKEKRYNKKRRDMK